MPIRLFLAPLLLVLLTACGRQPEPEAGPAAQPAASTETTAPRVAPLGPSPWHGGRAPTEGVDYVRIAPAAPYSPRAGRIEVVEVFGYTCVHCANLQPLVNGWKPTLAEDVDFLYLPAAFGGFWTPYARAFYAAELTGVLAETHDAMFDAVHRRRALPVTAEAAPQIVAWYAQRGVDAERFAAAMDNFGVNAAINRSQQVMRRWKVESTPTLIVAGKYRLEPTREHGLEGLLHTADWLIAQERAAR